MTYYATKAFSVGVGGRMTAYAIGDAVQPAHAMIAPAFCAPEGYALDVLAELEKAEPKPAKAAKKAAKKNGKKD